MSATPSDRLLATPTGAWEREAVASPTPLPPSDEPQNSIRAPIESDRARIVFDPKPIRELGTAVPPEWVWPGSLARGHMTLFTGLWKAGKSALIGHLLRDLQLG